METKIVNYCRNLKCDKCMRGDHDHGVCQYIGTQETCKYFDSNYAYQEKIWYNRIYAIAAETFPYETEETCPNALDRTLKNLAVDNLRVGFIKGYERGGRDSIACA